MSTLEMALERVLGRPCGCAGRRARLQRWWNRQARWIRDLLTTLFEGIETLWVRHEGAWVEVFDLSVPDPCEGAPTISSHTSADLGATLCSGGGGWQTRSDVSLSGTLGSFQIQRQVNLDGAGWTDWTVNQVTSDPGQTRTDWAGLYGLDEGFGTTRSIQHRARIVGSGGPSEPCGDWVTATALNRSMEDCLD